MKFIDKLMIVTYKSEATIAAAFVQCLINVNDDDAVRSH